MKRTLFSFFLLLIILIFSGCASADKKPISVTSTKFNTVVSITIYDKTDQTLLDECLALCDKYEQIFSRTLETSELYQLNQNHIPGKSYPVSDELYELLSVGLSYTQKTGGAFSIALAPLTSLWDFSSKEGRVPASEAITNALDFVSYKNIQLENSSVTFHYHPEASADTLSESALYSVKSGTSAVDSSFSYANRMGIDLGAIAKGYVADRLKEFLISQGVESALINLGGNILTIGSRPDGSDFTIGIQKPFADYSETVAAMKISDKSVVSSGIYERCFEEDGILYHHLLNPSTGYPYDNELVSVTIISDHSVDGDALSTVCFALGLEKGLEFLESIPDADGFFITAEGDVHYTDEFEKKYKIFSAN